MLEPIIYLALFGLAGWAIAQLVRWLATGRRPRSLHGKPAGGVKPVLEKRLVRLLNGDRAAAHRLVESVQQRYPDRPTAWCWEKAIFDLERDRFR
ncbi:hypothetical protein HPC62_00685 [Thermoleptolyngbya sichuanensis A183]|uniref:Uncharacterized protein n=1 Tax=Thermoleptolyngbya sichuanensis A183 TaxID=2737172 RepID=A0A6M8BBE6_9CYAN|nr:MULTISPECIES: hypothetical protein [Thermoleptolyngbya]MDG2615549.1 hypothetical protein [Thermoleptolyngbya sichuanensis XZ-Cy5]QKD80881.1 hypothetical protein HPC62_00685 [Thermoleptolyngbya sichuanensis A183]